MRSLFLPKCRPKITRISTLPNKQGSLPKKLPTLTKNHQKNATILVCLVGQKSLHFGRNNDLMNSFWIWLTFSYIQKYWDSLSVLTQILFGLFFITFKFVNLFSIHFQFYCGHSSWILPHFFQVEAFLDLHWHIKKTAESKNRVKRGYLVVLKERKVGWNYTPGWIKNCGYWNCGNWGMPVISLCPIHVVSFVLISNLISDLISNLGIASMLIIP